MGHAGSGGVARRVGAHAHAPKSIRGGGRLRLRLDARLCGSCSHRVGSAFARQPSLPCSDQKLGSRLPHSSPSLCAWRASSASCSPSAPSKSRRSPGPGDASRAATACHVLNLRLEQDAMISAQRRRRHEHERNRTPHVDLARRLRRRTRPGPRASPRSPPRTVCDALALPRRRSAIVGVELGGDDRKFGRTLLP
jgi:hypothetical protein